MIISLIAHTLFRVGFEMARFQKNENGYSLALSGDEFEKLQLSPAKDYELFNAGKGAYIMNEKPAQEYSAAEQRVIEMLKYKPLAQRIEGMFERTLKADELPALNALLKKGVAEKFRLSDKYKYAIYRLAEKEAEKRQETKEAVQAAPQGERAVDSYTFKKDGFMVVKNENLARELSDQYYDLIKAGKMQGTRGFDGLFYIVYSDLYNKHSGKILSTLKTGACNTDELAEKLKIDKNLAKAVCELLREKGDLMEKRKNVYCVVE